MRQARCKWEVGPDHAGVLETIMKTVAFILNETGSHYRLLIYLNMNSLAVVLESIRDVCL